MTDIYELFKEETWEPDDYTQYPWVRGSIDELSFNKENNIDELMNCDGDTYSYNITSEFERDNFVIFTLRNDCGGESFQAIFDLSKMVDCDKYWEEYEDEEE